MCRLYFRLFLRYAVCLLCSCLFFSHAHAANLAKKWHDNSAWADLDVHYENIPKSASLGSGIKIHCTRYSSGAVQLMYTGVPLTKGKTYTLSFKVRSLEGVIPVGISGRRRHRPFTKYFSCKTRAGRDLKTISFDVVPSKTDSDATIIFSFKMEGAVELYDVHFASSPPKSATAKKQNLIMNSSFEVGLDKWGIHYKANPTFKGKPLPAGGHDYIKYTHTNPHISNTFSKHGNASLMIPIPEGGMAYVTTHYFPTQPGARYTFSAWVRSSSSTQIALKATSGQLRQPGPSSKTTWKKVDKKWQRVSVDFTAQTAPNNLYYPVIKCFGPGDLFIDAVQVSQNYKNASYAPCQQFEAGIQVQDAILHPQQKLNFVIRAWGKIRDTEGLFVTILDESEQQVYKRTISASELKKAKNSISIRLTDIPPGYYKICAFQSTDPQKPLSKKAFCVVPEPKAPSFDSPFGVHAELRDHDLDLIKDIGVSWIRLHATANLTKWNSVEPSHGKFSFYDLPIEEARKKGFFLLGTLDMTPSWASTVPPSYQGGWLHGPPAYMPNSLASWRKYVKKTVARYAGVIDHWEVWNEPDTNFFRVNEKANKAKAYVSLLRTAYVTAKSVNAKAKLLAPCASHHPITHWTKQIIHEGGAQYLDIFSYHRYTDGISGDLATPSTSTLIKEIRQILKNCNNSAEIWESESGILMPGTAYKYHQTPSNLEAVPAEEGPRFFVRNMTHLLSSGVKKWFYFTGAVTRRIDHLFSPGLFEWDASPKPMAVAYANMANLIDHAEFVDHKTTKGGVEVHTFIEGGRIIKVLWSDSDGATYPIDKLPKPTVITMYGKITTPASEENNVVITSDPIYIVYDDHM